MKITLLFIQIRDVSIVSMIILLFLSVTAVAKTYRWIDENGKVYYSHDIPPSAAQNGHSEMNKAGRVVNDISSRQEREKEREQALLLKEKEKQKQLKMRENMSLQLFSSRAEAVKHFERRLEMVSVNLRLFQYHKRRLLKEITKIQQRISNIKTNKEKRQLSKRLQKMQSTLLEHSRAIENNQQEQIVTSENKKRALSKYDGGMEEKKEKGTMSSVLSTGINKSTSACSCVCDKNKPL